MMIEHIEIRQVFEKKDLEAVKELEDFIWGNRTPVHQTFTALKNGGLVIGAYFGNKLIGFSYSFAGFDGEKNYLCSHMLGLLPEFRKSGIGVKIKRKQAEIAEQMGYHMIRWTFDPLESVNANLNISKLGAIGAHYKENYYGVMNDGLNRGMPTDRMIIEWRRGERCCVHINTVDKSRLLLTKNNNTPVYTDAFKNPLNESAYFIAVPENIQEIKENNINLAKQWRKKTREVFLLLFAQGFVAKGFLRDKQYQLGYYYLSK